VAALDTASGRRVAYRADERFPMCSTFKVLLVSAVLHRFDRKQEQLDRFIHYGATDLLSHAPITKQHLPEGSMTVEALCGAAISYSDNTAGNLLLATIGGPEGLTGYARSLGDSVTRLDRPEEELNSALPGDPRDTTSPLAMLANLRLLLLGDALAPASRVKIEAWMSANTTGDTLIRAGLPGTWQIGDKTGRSANGTTNDIAIVRPPKRAPILLCIYSSEGHSDSAERDKTIAEISRLVVDE
jgi:beta-lactamase class A